MNGSGSDTSKKKPEPTRSKNKSPGPFPILKISLYLYNDKQDPILDNPDKISVFLLLLYVQEVLTHFM